MPEPNQPTGQQPDQGQQQANPAMPHPDFSKPPAGPGEKREMPIYMMPDVYQSLQSELAELRTYRERIQAETEAKEQERLKTLMAKSQAEEQFKQYQSAMESKLADSQSKYKDVEARWLDEKRNAAIAEAISGVGFTGADPQATAAMVRRLLEGEIEAVRDNSGNPVVRDRQRLRPAVEHLRERLASPEFAIFIQANSRGGAGGDGTRMPANQAAPKDAYEVFAQQYRERMEMAKAGRIPR